MMQHFFSDSCDHAEIRFIRQGPIYPIWSITWLMMDWQHKEPEHQQPWHWPVSPRLFWFQHHTWTMKVNNLQGQWPPFSIPAEGIPGCMLGANLVIPAQTCDELSCGQGKVYGRTDRQMGGQMDRCRQRQDPFGLKGQGVKMTWSTWPTKMK